MIGINLLRKNPAIVKDEVRKRHLDIDVDEIISDDKKWREMLEKVESMRSKVKDVSDNIATLSGKEKEKFINDQKKESVIIKKLEREEKEIKNKLHESLYCLPNITHESVPVGKDEKGNVVEETWGEPPKFDFKPKDHIKLGKELDLIDIERGVKISGSRFYFLKNEAVELEFAIIRYLLDYLGKKGYTPMLAPMLVKDKAMYGTGFFPAEKNEIYNVNPKEDDLYLIGTSEVPLASYHMKDTLNEEELPKKYTAFSSCFRREAGAYGKDTTGILRVHQFDKLEMFKYVTEENSWDEYDDLINTAEEIVRSLKIPYQKVNMCTGDISLPTAKKYDLEAYMPGEGKYREIVSGTNVTDFQARRLNIKYKTKDGKKKYVHMMNCTAYASTRILITILENFQQADGSVKIPEVLVPYMNNKKIIAKK